MQLRCLPVHAAVDRDVDLFDLAAAAPGQAADFIKPGRRHRLLRAGKGDDGFRLVDPGEAARFAVRHQLGVFRCLLPGVPRRVAELDPAQPFDADVALPTRNQDAQRISLLWPQRFAVLGVDDKAIVEAFGERQAAVHAGAVGAFDHDPFGFLLQPDLVEKGRERHAGPFGAADHAVGELQRVELRLAPFHAAVGWAFDEMDARHRREADDVVHRQHQRPLDQAMDQEPVLARVDVDAAGVEALEEQPVRGDDAVQGLQRRKADRGFLARREPGHVAANDLLFEFGRLAVGPVDNTGADGLRPFRLARGRRLARGTPCPAEHRAAGDGGTEAQQGATRIARRQYAAASVHSLTHPASLRTVTPGRCAATLVLAIVAARPVA